MGTENASSSSSSCFPSSSSIVPGWRYKYDVFLSFRGSDTRKKFTSHLYEALKRNGITTFRDDESLERGEFISPELMRAIKESRFAVVIFSKNYASSSWCLTELAKIVKCMNKKKLTVLPIFYDVDPSDVRKLRGTFAEAFAKHLNNSTKNVHTWKDAMTKVAGISGWDLQEESESTVIEKIIQRISLELNHKFSIVFEHLVGMDTRVKEMLGLCTREGLDCVHFVGICGMGGIGKTTLAQEIYGRIYCDFEACCFLENVREDTKSKGLVSLQNILLSKIFKGTEINIHDLYEGINVIGTRLRNKKVLIVLDDVNEEKQLEALAGNGGWFGLGSIIIVTSRDRHLLRRHGVKNIYETKELNEDEALKLFSWKAFKKPHLEENYVDLSMDFVRYANGLPLALEVLGSSLFGRKLDAWRSARDKLEAKPYRGIMEILQISLAGLEDTQKELFLDIACFFKGQQICSVRDTLESLGHYPDYDIYVLMDKYLITIATDGTLSMHDLLQEMGQDIVCCESPKEPGRRSRLWCYKDVLHVLKYNTGSEFVEGMVLNMPVDKNESLSVEAFSKMRNLRFLKIGYVEPEQGHNRGHIQLPKGLIYLSNELRIIDWHGYPLKSMPTSFQPIKLVELRMHCSGIKKLWKGIMDLRLLPELPLNIKYFGAEGCTSLETLPLRPEDVFSPYLFLINCVKLIDNQGFSDMFSTMLARYIQRPDYLGYQNFIIPGSEIPNWFSHQSEGNSLILHGPSDIRGIAVCVVFVIRPHLSLHLPPLELFSATHWIDLYCSVNGSLNLRSGGVGLSEQFGKIDSCHLWIKYVPLKGKWDKELSQIDANRSSPIAIKIEIKGPGFVVTKLGACLVYEQDIEDLKQNMPGSSSCSITPYEDNLDDSTKDTKTRQSCDDSNGDGAGPSEEGTSNEVDEPLPTWIHTTP